MTTHAPVLGVSTCLFRDGAVLLVERAHAPYRGCLSLPGGRVEFGETLEAAARREVREETGLVVERLRFGTLHEAIGDGFHAVIAVHSGAVPAGAVARAGDDAAAVRFAAPGELFQLEAAGRTTPGLAAIVARLADA